MSTPDAWEAVHQTLHRLERRWLPPFPPDADVFYAYDPLPVAEFFPTVEVASALTSGRRFLDVGCGIGTKLALMHVLEWEVAGIDRHLPYLEIARDLVPEATLTHADLRDVESFDADLVFMYRPGVSDETAVALELHVAQRVSAGTLLFLPTRTLPEGVTAERLDSHLWRVT